MKFQGKTVITGGVGFIGTHIAERLCGTTELVLFDNLRRDSLSALPGLRAAAGVTFMQGDVLDRASVSQALAGADTVLHLAAIAGVSSYYEQPLVTFQVNLLGTVNVMEMARAAGVRRLIHLSTSEVFGLDAMWVSEESFRHLGNFSDRRWSYATSKLASEQFVMWFGEAHGIGCTVLRPFNVYGPRQTGEGAIGNFCRAATRGEPLTVYGDGTPIRSWCYVSDFVDAVVAALKTPAAIGQDFNIGNPRETETTLGLARAVARLRPGTVIEFKEVKRTDVRARVPVIEKARRILGFEPQVSLEDGLRQTMVWYRSGAKA